VSIRNQDRGGACPATCRTTCPSTCSTTGLTTCPTTCPQACRRALRRAPARTSGRTLPGASGKALRRPGRPVSDVRGQGVRPRRLLPHDTPRPSPADPVTGLSNVQLAARSCGSSSPLLTSVTHNSLSPVTAPRRVRLPAFGRRTRPHPGGPNRPVRPVRAVRTCHPTCPTPVGPTGVLCSRSRPAHQECLGVFCAGLCSRAGNA